LRVSARLSAAGTPQRTFPTALCDLFTSFLGNVCFKSNK
jgi:hypothetical protein